MFLFWAPHIVHTPLQVPEAYIKRFEDVQDWRRRRYLAMVNYVSAVMFFEVSILELANSKLGLLLHRRTR